MEKTEEIKTLFVRRGVLKELLSQEHNCLTRKTIMEMIYEIELKIDQLIIIDRH